jgi:hypothetical protein
MTSQSPIALIGLARLSRTFDCHDPEKWNWRARLCFTSHGAHISIRVTEPAVLVPVKLRLPPGSREVEETGQEQLYSLAVGDETGPAGMNRLHLLFRGNSLVSASYKLEAVLGALESELDREVAVQAAPQWVFVRAGVVGWHGRAIVIAGAPQSGTSTLTAALLRAGSNYYSDQYAVFNSEGRVHPFARPLWLCTGASGCPVRYRAEELGAKPAVQALPVGVVVLARYCQGARMQLAPLTPSVAPRELMAETVCARSHPAAALMAIQNATESAWILKGIRGEAEEIVRLLLGPGIRHRR